MGGRGSNSPFAGFKVKCANGVPWPILFPSQDSDDDDDVDTTPLPASQQPGPLGVSLAEVQAMSDQELHDFLINVYHTDIPDFLNDVHLQKMIYSLGLNDGPEIVSQQEFDNMVSAGNEVIYRTVNPTTVNGVSFSANDICDMLTDGDVTYVGVGVHGDGLYFSNDLRGSKAYGYSSQAKTVGAVFNGKARIITEGRLRSQYDAFVKTHPQTQKALGYARSKSYHDSMSQFALIQGYNVIVSQQTSTEDYYTVLDRSVLTMTRKRY